MASSGSGPGSLSAMPAGDRKIPDPMVEPTRTATALQRPSRRGSADARANCESDCGDPETSPTKSGSAIRIREFKTAPGGRGFFASLPLFHPPNEPALCLDHFLDCRFRYTLCVLRQPDRVLQPLASQL